ncbi:MAG: hypothetical protein DMG73_17705 [Acidobacteria bacterium]|nr:MAG: hypothetical protein DMG75_06650 [Acidobacteriota bacterium]PYX55267.1 MAG: hypothetical protein DMG73_17705 [Acidobacteriota bacterium]PYX64113.1 MAG: hypothetical protein DMG74_14275 [Acidobacteriota bacterium]
MPRQVMRSPAGDVSFLFCSTTTGTDCRPRALARRPS